MFNTHDKVHHIAASSSIMIDNPTEIIKPSFWFSNRHCLGRSYRHTTNRGLTFMKSLMIRNTLFICGWHRICLQMPNSKERVYQLLSNVPYVRHISNDICKPGPLVCIGTQSVGSKF